MRATLQLHFALWLSVLALPSGAHAVTITFEGLAPFSSPGATLPGVVFSADAGVLDEASVAGVTGLVAPPGSVAVSGVNLLANLFGPVLTLTFTSPVASASLHSVGSLAGGVFGSVSVLAFDGSSLVDSDASDPGALGDSGAPEALLAVSAPGGITSLVLSSDIGGAASFLIDDLEFTVLPEPGTLLQGLLGVFLLWRVREGVLRADG